jgi:hypothetical protein
MGVFLNHIDELEIDRKELANKFPVPPEIYHFHMFSESLNHLLKSRESIHRSILDSVSELPEDYINDVLKQVHISTIECVERLVRQFFDVEKAKIKKEKKARGRPTKRKAE